MTFSIPEFACYIFSRQIPDSSYELPALAITNMKNEGPGNVTCLKHKSEIRGTC